MTSPKAVKDKKHHHRYRIVDPVGNGYQDPIFKCKCGAVKDKRRKHRHRYNICSCCQEAEYGYCCCSSEPMCECGQVKP